MIFDEIFMINTYYKFGYIYENNNCYYGNGFAICHSISKKKYNIFPIWEEYVNFNDIPKVKVNNNILNFVHEHN